MASRVAAREADLRRYAEVGPDLVDLLSRLAAFQHKRSQSTILSLIMAAVRLVGQCSIFVRNREQLANPPVSLALDGATIERLTRLERLGTRWTGGGIKVGGRSYCMSGKGFVEPPLSSIAGGTPGLTLTSGRA